MSYSYTSDEVFTEYDNSESKLIEGWLKEHGYRWLQPTLCGNCCGMFEGYYRINGIGGKWKSKKDKEDFAQFAAQNNIPFSKKELEHSTINPLEDEDDD